MWVFLNDAFLSIVDQEAKETGRETEIAQDGDVMVVRARLKGDIERVFAHLVGKKKLKVIETPQNDYRFRAMIPRSVVKAAMAAEVDRVTYGNFKNTVHDDDRHNAYSGVWGVMYRLQNAKMGGRTGPKGGRLF